MIWMVQGESGQRNWRRSETNLQNPVDFSRFKGWSLQDSVIHIKWLLPADYDQSVALPRSPKFSSGPQQNAQRAQRAQQLSHAFCKGFTWLSSSGRGEIVTLWLTFASTMWQCHNDVWLCYRIPKNTQMTEMLSLHLPVTSFPEAQVVWSLVLACWQSLAMSVHAVSFVSCLPGKLMG